MADARDFETVLRALARSEPLHVAQQMMLMDLSRQQVPDFQKAWNRLQEAERLAALDALIRMTEENVRLDFNAVYRAVLRDPAPSVRAAAVRACGEDDNQAFLEPLLDLVARDPDPGVREAAAEALGIFAFGAEVGEMDEHAGQRVRTALMARLQDVTEQSGVRGAALASVGYFSQPEIQAAIEAALNEPDLERAAVTAMGRSADARWLERLDAYTHRPEGELREEAARAFGEIEDGSAMPRLLEMVDDPSVSVRIAVLQALGTIGGEEAREALLYAAESPDQATADAARAALSDLEFYEDPMAL